MVVIRVFKMFLCRLQKAPASDERTGQFLVQLTGERCARRLACQLSRLVIKLVAMQPRMQPPKLIAKAGMWHV
jgi:hypothetical protein